MAPEPEATGYKGFYYHFLDLKTGRRTWDCELSTIDSAFLIAGALTAAEYFNRDTKGEREIRGLAGAIYARRRLAMGAAPRSHGHTWMAT
jgi:hypothetical protein